MFIILIFCHFENAKYAYQLDLIKELFTYKQLAYRFDRFEKFLKENPTNFTGTLQQKVHEIVKDVLPEITGVSDNFLKLESVDSLLSLTSVFNRAISQFKFWIHPDIVGAAFSLGCSLNRLT